MKYFKGKKKDILKSRDSVHLDIKPADSIESVLFKCGLLDGEQPGKIARTDENISNLDSISSKAEIEWPFLAGLSLTLADLLIVSCFIELFSKVCFFSSKYLST